MTKLEASLTQNTAPPPKREDQLRWQLGLAGCACLVAQSSVHWVETTMVRQQLAEHPKSMPATVGEIARGEGVAALYRGFVAAGLREMSYSSLRFGLYEPLKKALGAEDPATAPFYKKVLAGLLAGAFASAVASPTDLLKIRAQSETGAARSIAAHCRDIANVPGGQAFWPLNFYNGVSATILRASCLGATKMATYDGTKTWLRSAAGWRDDVPKERYALQGVAAFVAGFAITVTTSPATNARTFIMSSPPGRFKHLGDALLFIVQERGPLGLFRGFGAQWARFGPYAVVQYYTWEQLRLLAGMRPL